MCALRLKDERLLVCFAEEGETSVLFSTSAYLYMKALDLRHPGVSSALKYSPHSKVDRLGLLKFY